MALKYGIDEWRAYMPRDDSAAPIVLCFGDSWFWYPIPVIGNLPSRFLEFGSNQAIDFAVLGENGMRITAPGERLLGELTSFLRWESKTLGMIMVSGGGNDFTGTGNMDPILKRGVTGDIESWFIPEKCAELFERIKMGYERILSLRDNYCPGIPVVVHGYGYAYATGKGILCFTPWLKPSLDKIGMPEEMHTGAVKFLVDRFAQVHASFISRDYHFIDTRACLAKDDWSNELHPNMQGFNKIARQFYPVLEQYFPNWVRKPFWF